MNEGLPVRLSNRGGVVRPGLPVLAQASRSNAIENALAGVATASPLFSLPAAPPLSAAAQASHRDLAIAFGMARPQPVPGALTSIQWSLVMIWGSGGGDGVSRRQPRPAPIQIASGTLTFGALFNGDAGFIGRIPAPPGAASLQAIVVPIGDAVPLLQFSFAAWDYPVPAAGLPLYEVPQL